MLQTWHKWQSSAPNVNPGTVVVLKDIQSPRNEWPFGLVTNVFPSTNGKVRTEEIRVAGPRGTKLFTRSISQITVLVNGVNYCNARWGVFCLVHNI